MTICVNYLIYLPVIAFRTGNIVFMLNGFSRTNVVMGFQTFNEMVEDYKSNDHFLPNLTTLHLFTQYQVIASYLYKIESTIGSFDSDTLQIRFWSPHLSKF